MLVKTSQVTMEEFYKTLGVDPTVGEMGKEFTVGQRVQFYRKDSEDHTLAINGTIRRIDYKTGWLHVEHKWGWAVVKPDQEKMQVLQQKANKSQAYAEAYGYDAVDVVSVSGSGNGPNPQNVSK